MTLFLISVLLILLVTLYLLARPLLKTQNTLSYERQAQNIHYAKERLAELEEQLKNASITATDYEALKLEIESNLASDIDLAEQIQADQQVTPRRSNKAMLSLLICLLPLSALGVYWLTGTPHALSEKTLASDERPSADQINAMLANIERRLANNPEDLKGWGVLARTYLSLGRYREARNGFLKLIELEGESAEVLTALADASGLMAGGDMSGEPSTYIKRALELEPNNPQALWLAGLSAAQQNKTQQAREYWTKLLPLLANAPKQQEELKTIIQQTFSGPGSNSLSLPDSAGDTDNNVSSKADASNTANNSAITPKLNVTVTLSDEVSNNVSKDDLVFVFARAQNGPPAPLAVKRLTVADLPTTITLGDADAMMPQLKMSLFADLVVSARVAKSGNPVAQSGDIQSAETKTKNDSTDNITLEINSVID